MEEPSPGLRVDASQSIDAQELGLLRKENQDLIELVDSLKEKVREKTVECNRANKKLQ